MLRVFFALEYLSRIIYFRDQFPFSFFFVFYIFRNSGDVLKCTETAMEETR